ncbi:MepB family protein [Flavobacterium sp. SOK18b]|uniref:MepB family protein n=1 Tax=Flavobacterium sp. SOK18b TaxID=797900 RepID=UPI0015FE0919|nr:MepB family protein [Flavobacterium sp. SOK18b]MBB1193743.1 MepB family protein [Flavobacterium sp. SOK18b]
MTNSSNIFSEIQLLNNSIFKVCGIQLENLEIEKESQEYFAHNFELNKQKVKFRMAKITPTKTGQFVSIWKRNEKGITEPHNVDDYFEFYFIATRQAERFGVFIFNKTVLSENRILTSPKGKGKLGIRVYPNWSVTENKQAQKTQKWQTKYFVEIGNSNEIDLNKLKKLLKLELEGDE